MSNTLLIRVQSSQGTKRVHMHSQDTYNDLYNKIADALSLPLSDDWILYQEQNKRSPMVRSQRKINLRHGDMIYLIGERENNYPLMIKSDASTDHLISKILERKEDEVDLRLEQLDGRISRERDAQLYKCHHNAHGKCLHCIPIEPYDEDYLKNHQPPIKHMSFQAYIRKLQSLASGDRNTLPSLQNINCSIKDHCSSGHPSWPKGICMKCQPNPVTLMRQSYRHVDNIMFENGNMVDRFLNYWRSFGHQRLGYLYGRYEVYDGVPLGVRAIVVAIYEPPQETSKDHVQLILPDAHEIIVEELADRLGLRRIGWIFTDLLPNNQRTRTGPVLHHRGTIDTCFLTAEECLMAGWYQNKHLNRCKYSPDGYSGSKFVTVVVTGDASGQIHFEGYQVSNQCMALIKAEIFLPTLDAPELGFIKETSAEQYVPDVYYKEKDFYNNEIMKIGRPLPLEYLIIDIPTGFPTDSTRLQSTFNDNCSVITVPFCVENRTYTQELQDMDTFTLYLQQFSDANASRTSAFTVRDILADFHVLRYLLINDIMPFSMDRLCPLLDALRANDLHGVEKWMESEDWQTLLHLLQIELPCTSKHSLVQTDPEDRLTSEWTCTQCTYLNANVNRQCDMCSSTRTVFA